VKSGLRVGSVCFAPSTTPGPIRDLVHLHQTHLGDSGKGTGLDRHYSGVKA
jgi:hypothetical protein